MRSAWILGIVVAGAVAVPAHAASSAQLTAVAYDPPSGPTPDCTAPLPGLDGRGSASRQDSGHKAGFAWRVPATMTAGASAQTYVEIETYNNGGNSAAIALKPTFEFGTNADARQQIVATVPVGAPGKDSDQETYSFTPTREFVEGEKLYLRIEIGCINFIYEYTGRAGASPCPTRWTGIPKAFASACATKEIEAPAPGDSKIVRTPNPGGTRATTTVSSSTGSLDGTVFVGEGELTQQDVVAHAVAQCWLIGPEALPLNEGFKKLVKYEEFIKLWKQIENRPQLALAFCIAFARKLFAELEGNDPDARAAASRCAVRRVAITARRRRGKLRLKLTKARPPRAVRYTCADAPDGALKFAVNGRLRKQLGPKLDLGVVRSPKAPADGSRLTFAFGS